MIRLYNPYTGEHFYTASPVERNHLESVGWYYEGVGWYAPSEGANVYRLYNRFAGDHHYTMSTVERDALVRAGWNDEGVGWKSYEFEGKEPVYRQYNPYAWVGTHNYTVNAGENSALVAAGWRAEGVAWNALPGSGHIAAQTAQPPVIPRYKDLGVWARYNQYSVGLPTGCESMALTHLLGWWGFDLGPTVIADQYMPWSNNDFVWKFMGNPHNRSGLTILSPGLTQTANRFLESRGSRHRARDISGTSFNSLMSYLERGIPVVIWNTVDLHEPGHIYWQGNYHTADWTHTIVLSGYNYNTGQVLVADSIAGNVWRNAGALAQRYEQMGAQALVIE